jgi:hypothetical protein
MQRHPRLVPLLMFLASVGWSVFLLLEALQRWRFERICSMTCGPFWDAELIGQLRAEMDWQTPLALAALPLALWGASSLLCGRGGLTRRPLDPR